MGVTVRQKERGRGQPWWVFVHHDGRCRSKKIGDRQAAEAVASELRRRMKLGQMNIPSTDDSATKAPLFRNYVEHYMDSYAKVACKWTTWTGYQTIIDKHLLPQWRHKRLDQITRCDVKRLLLMKQNQGLSPSTVENIKALVSGIFTHAYEDEILAANPALKLGKFIQKQDRRRHVHPLTREQAGQMLAVCKRQFPLHHPILLCAFRTGMRLGELMGLAWEDIDFAGNRMTVRRGYSHGRFSTPKSHKSRVVDMSDQLRETLLAHRSRLTQFHRGHQPGCEVPGARGKAETIHLAFPNEAGGPFDGDNFRSRVFYKLLEEADVPRIRFHDIRHTFASLLLQQGESLHYVKEQMGHASIQTTVDVYGHLVPGSNRNAVNRLDDPMPTPDLRLTAAG